MVRMNIPESIIKTWGMASIVIQNYFNRREMAICFPELQYYELDWKAHKIATEAYPHWTPPTKKVKQEVNKVSTIFKSSKKHPHSPTVVSKKAKKLSLRRHLWNPFLAHLCLSL